MFLAIVPAYNESKRVGSVVRSLLLHVDTVLVVDDGSTDDTAEIAWQAGATVLTHRLNRGQGAALETGHVYARRVGAEYILHFDADGQFSVDDILPALSLLKHAQVDIIFGSRYKDSRSNVPWTKKYLLRPIGKLVDRMIGGLKLSDAPNGFRLFNKNALHTLSLTHSGMAHASEIPALVKKHGLRYMEVPVSVMYHEYGQGIGGGIRVVRDLLLGKFSK